MVNGQAYYFNFTTSPPVYGDLCGSGTTAFQSRSETRGWGTTRAFSIGTHYSQTWSLRIAKIAIFQPSCVHAPFLIPKKLASWMVESEALSSISFNAFLHSSIGTVGYAVPPPAAAALFLPTPVSLRTGKARRPPFRQPCAGLSQTEQLIDCGVSGCIQWWWA